MPLDTTKPIQSKFKLNNDKMEEPAIYLGAEFSNMDKKHGDKLWSLSSEKYCSDMVNNIDTTFKNKGLKFPSKCVTPMNN